MVRKRPRTIIGLLKQCVSEARDCPYQNADGCRFYSETDFLCEFYSFERGCTFNPGKPDTLDGLKVYQSIGDQKLPRIGRNNRGSNPSYYSRSAKRLRKV